MVALRTASAVRGSAAGVKAVHGTRAIGVRADSRGRRRRRGVWRVLRWAMRVGRGMMLLGRGRGKGARCWHRTDGLAQNVPSRIGQRCAQWRNRKSIPRPKHHQVTKKTMLGKQMQNCDGHPENTQSAGDGSLRRLLDCREIIPAPVVVQARSGSQLSLKSRSPKDGRATERPANSCRKGRRRCLLRVLNAGDFSYLL